MKKGTLALAITLTAFGSIPANSAEVCPWKAKDPYLGTTYEKEHVSTFAKFGSAVATIGSGIGMVGYAGRYVYDNYTTASYVLPSLQYSIHNVPTLNAFGQIAIVGTSLIFLGIPSNMLLTYGAKKGAMALETIMTFGWDVFKYGFDAVKYRFDHLRAIYLQGTLWQNNNVKYVDTSALNVPVSDRQPVNTAQGDNNEESTDD